MLLTMTMGLFATNAFAQSTSHSIGDIITFGHYEQDGDLTNGKEPIKWRVIDKNADGDYFLMSEYILDTKPHNLEHVRLLSCTTNIWAKSTLRSWLNGYPEAYNKCNQDFTSSNFIGEAFTPEEIAKIVPFNVPVYNNKWNINEPGIPTTDKVFILSIQEVNKYLTAFNANFKDLRASATYNVILKNKTLCSQSVDYCNLIWNRSNDERRSELKFEKLNIKRCNSKKDCLMNWWLRGLGGQQGTGFIDGKSPRRNFWGIAELKKLSLGGIPSLIINGKHLRGIQPFEKIKKEIDAALSAKK